MENLETIIDRLLREEDVEGFIAIGAPDNEYSPEAKEIYKGLLSLNANEHTEIRIASLIAGVWEKYFDLSSEDLQKRSAAFHRIAQGLLQT